MSADPAAMRDSLAKGHQAARSFLMVECGRATVKAFLFDTVEGRHALIGRASAISTVDQPWFDVRVGVRQALAQITAISGRPLLDRSGRVLRPARADGAGVDWFGILLSGAEPLQAVAIGQLDEVSLASVRGALGSVYALEVDGFSAVDGRGPWRRIGDLVTTAPDVVVVGGGSNGGAQRRPLGLTEEVALACEIMDAQARPVVVLAGNRQVQEQAISRLGDLTDVRAVANVRPEANAEQLDETVRTLEALYVERKGAAWPGFIDLRQWADAGPRPVTRAFEATCGLLAADTDGAVLALDLGAGSVTLVRARPGATELRVHTELGLGQTLAPAPEWSPPVPERQKSKQSASLLGDYLFEKRLKQQASPLTATGLAKERELIQATLGAVARANSVIRQTPLDGLVLRGQCFGPDQDDAELLQAVLAGLQVYGLFWVMIDRWDVLPAAGYLAEVIPALAAQVLASEAEKRLGWVAAVRFGRFRPGHAALRVSLQGSAGFELRREIMAGESVQLAAPAGQRLELALEPLGRADVGRGPGQTVRAVIEGSRFGLLVDARQPRPVG